MGLENIMVKQILHLSGGIFHYVTLGLFIFVASSYSPLTNLELNKRRGEDVKRTTEWFSKLYTASLGNLSRLFSTTISNDSQPP